MLTESRCCSRLTISRSCGWLNIAVHAESTNGVEPTPLILACININRHLQTLAHLDIELLETVLAKNLKEDLLGILVLCL